MTDRQSTDDLALAAEFPGATYEEWRKLAQAAIKGARYEDRLQSRTADGLIIEALYGRAQTASPVGGRQGGVRWRVLQRVDHPDPAAANALALEDLEGGANGLVLVGADAVGAHGYGLLAEPDTLDVVLDGIHLDAGTAIELDLGPQSARLPRALAALVARRGLAAATLDVRFGLDPFGAALQSGGYDTPLAELSRTIGQFARDLALLGFKRSLLVADGRVVHGAGGTEAQELAYVVAAAIAYLRALEASGIGLEDARRMIFFRLAADTDQLLTIAKFRALRRLWARIEESCGLPPQPAFVVAETAWRTMTRNDPLVNILRATIATFAAGTGGADAVTVVPFTAARGLPDAFARRVARNTQLILLDESSLARVADPTAGTGWSEQLADQLCRTAWALLQEIEAAGGAAAALQQGLIQHKVKAARAERERAVATRRDALIGANEFPDIGEAPVAVLDVAPVTRPSQAASAAVPIERLAPMRLAQPFEVLREASDRALATTGTRPRVFLANLGLPADFAARANFAKNVFEAGGIEAISNQGFASNEALAAAFKTCATPLACLCGTDEVYAQTGSEAATLLRQAGAAHIYGAGRPGPLEQDLRRAGVGSFIYSGCDVLATLRDACRRLGTLTAGPQE